MAETQVPIGLKKQDAGDEDWETGLNSGIDDADTRLTLTNAGTPDLILAGDWLGQFALDTTNNELYICTLVGIATVARFTSYVAHKAIVNAFTRQQTFVALLTTGSGSIAWNLDTHQVRIITLDGTPSTLENPTNKKVGGMYTVIVKQDVTGSRLLTYGTDYKFPGGVEPILTTTAFAVDCLSFISDGTDMFGGVNYDFK